MTYRLGGLTRVVSPGFLEGSLEGSHEGFSGDFFWQLILGGARGRPLWVIP